MTDDLEPTSPTEEPQEIWVASRSGPGVEADEPSERWVTDPTGQTVRAPGIDDVQETTYVDPGARTQRWRLLVGAALALGGIAVFVGLIFVARAARDADRGADGKTVEVTRTTSLVTTTSTTPDSTSSSTAATGGSAGTGKSSTTTTAPPATPSPTAAAAAPTPPATADPALAPYVPVPVPTGVNATLSACSWQPANGGELQASGTITGVATRLEGWQITMRWLQNSRELAQQGARMYLAPGETKTWTLTASAPVPPADLACALEIA